MIRGFFLKRNNDEIILKRLPKEARLIIIAHPTKKRKTSETVKKIYKRYGKDISALAKS
jgi:hypothetical protein